MNRAVFIGFDQRQPGAFAVAKASLNHHLIFPIPVYGISLRDMRNQGLYRREVVVNPTLGDAVQLWDPISAAPMATEFSISRFLTYHLAYQMKFDWALFMDCDMLLRWDIGEVFRAYTDKSKALMCVQHRHEPEPGVKMDGQEQTRYARKNWSSFMLFNVNHPSNKRLTVEMVNTLPGRDLHRFCWLEDHEIGEIPQEWNWLVGHSSSQIIPKNVHFTDGIPTMKGYEDVAYAGDFFDRLSEWAAFPS